MLALGAAMMAATAHAQTYTVLHAFMGQDGAMPFGEGVILDRAGNLYGTTIEGGQAFAGVVYRLGPNGAEQVLYSFTSGAGGEYPQAGVIHDSAGNLYGTTHQGGITTGVCASVGCGTVYKLDKTGTYSVLHSFTGGADGGYSATGLILDAAGNLYGTASEGAFGTGVVFKLDTTNAETVLYSFMGGTDGAYPSGALLRDAAGNLYGTASLGGAFNQGVVFKVDTLGNETVLYSFTGGADGGSPGGGVVTDASGNLYGTAAAGGITKGICAKGIPAGCGVVFKLDPSGNETVLHTFTGRADGGFPSSGVIRDAAGNLYGEAALGGTATTSACSNTIGCGVVFKLDTSNVETVLHNFDERDGRNPAGGLVQDSAGNLYGTTEIGGSKQNFGVVFKLTP